MVTALNWIANVSAGVGLLAILFFFVRGRE
jgi:hypothetical protein